MIWRGVNGIKSDGSESVDLLGHEMRGRGHEVHDFEYPRRGVWSGRKKRFQWDDAWKLVEESNDGDNIFAHSRGCLSPVARAMECGRKFGDVWLFSPAMRKDWRFPIGAFENLFVIYNPFDSAINKTRFLLWGQFGLMGREGSDWIKAYPDLGRNIARPHYNGNTHGFYFGPDEIPLWADAMESHGSALFGGGS